MIKCISNTQRERYRKKFLRRKLLLCATTIIGLTSSLTYAENAELNPTDLLSTNNFFFLSEEKIISAENLNQNSEAVLDDNYSFDNNGATDVTVDSLIYVGKTKAGAFTIEDSTLTVDNKVILGHTNKSEGTINISGADFLVPAHKVVIGNVGVGNIVLTGENSRFTAQSIWLGQGTSGMGSLEVIQGNVRVGKEIRISSGKGSVGKLTVADGNITVPKITLGYSANSNGTLTLDGGDVDVTDSLTFKKQSTVTLDKGTLTVNKFNNVSKDDASKNDVDMTFSGGVLRFKYDQLSNFDLLLKQNKISWEPGSASTSQMNLYTPSTATRVVRDDDDDALYIREYDEDGYASVWSFQDPRPVVTNSTINLPFAEQDRDYKGTVVGQVTDPESKKLTYSKVSGPSWLVVTEDGSLSGRPSSGDVGKQVFTIEVSNSDHDSVTIENEIFVAENFSQLPVIFDDFDNINDLDAAWGNWRSDDQYAEISKTYAIERRIARKNRTPISRHSTSVNEQALHLKGNPDVNSSATLAKVLDLTSYNKLKIGFTYFTTGFSGNEKFALLYSDDGENWQTIKDFVTDDVTHEGLRKTIELSLDKNQFSFTRQALLRFQVDASDALDNVYIDNVSIFASSGLIDSEITANYAIKGSPYNDSLSNYLLYDKYTTFTLSDKSSWLKVSNDGKLSGKPTRTTQFGKPDHFVIIATDNKGKTSEITLNINVLAEEVTKVTDFFEDSIVLEALVNENFSYKVKDLVNPKHRGIIKKSTFMLSEAPSWLTLNTEGTLFSGTPTALGSNKFTLTAKNHNVVLDTTIIEIKVMEPATPDDVFVAEPSIIEVASGSEVNGDIQQFLSADGKKYAKKLTYTLQEDVEGLAWLTLDSNNRFSGTAPDQGGTTEITLTATYTDGSFTKTYERTLTIKVIELITPADVFVAEPFSIEALPGDDVNAYIRQFLSDDGKKYAKNLTYTLKKGEDLQWLSLDDKNRFSGTAPDKESTTEITLTATYTHGTFTKTYEKMLIIKVMWPTVFADEISYIKAVASKEINVDIKTLLSSQLSQYHARSIQYTLQKGVENLAWLRLDTRNRLSGTAPEEGSITDIILTATYTKGKLTKEYKKTLNVEVLAKKSIFDKSKELTNIKILKGEELTLSIDDYLSKRGEYNSKANEVYFDAVETKYFASSYDTKSKSFTVTRTKINKDKKDTQNKKGKKGKKDQGETYTFVVNANHVNANHSAKKYILDRISFSINVIERIYPENVFINDSKATPVIKVIAGSKVDLNIHQLLSVDGKAYNPLLKYTLNTDLNWLSLDAENHFSGTVPNKTSIDFITLTAEYNDGDLTKTYEQSFQVEVIDLVNNVFSESIDNFIATEPNKDFRFSIDKYLSKQAKNLVDKEEFSFEMKTAVNTLELTANDKIKTEFTVNSSVEGEFTFNVLVFRKKNEDKTLIGSMPFIAFITSGEGLFFQQGIIAKQAYKGLPYKDNLERMLNHEPMYKKTRELFFDFSKIKFEIEIVGTDINWLEVDKINGSENRLPDVYLKGTPTTHTTKGKDQAVKFKILNDGSEVDSLTLFINIKDVDLHLNKIADFFTEDSKKYSIQDKIKTKGCTLSDTSFICPIKNLIAAKYVSNTASPHYEQLTYRLEDQDGNKVASDNWVAIGTDNNITFAPSNTIAEDIYTYTLVASLLGKEVDQIELDVNHLHAKEIDTDSTIDTFKKTYLETLSVNTKFSGNFKDIFKETYPEETFEEAKYKRVYPRVVRNKPIWLTFITSDNKKHSLVAGDFSGVPEPDLSVANNIAKVILEATSDGKKYQLTLQLTLEQGGKVLLPELNTDDLTEAFPNLDYSEQLKISNPEEVPGGLVYKKISGPSWLRVRKDGKLSGKPTKRDLGDNVFTILVTSKRLIYARGEDGKVTDTKLYRNIVIDVTDRNYAPEFISSPVTGLSGTAGVKYKASLVSYVKDKNLDPITFNNDTGGWLEISDEGLLSGTPEEKHIGLNSFIVTANDGQGGTETVNLNIDIYEAGNNQAPDFNTDDNLSFEAVDGKFFTNTLAGTAHDPDKPGKDYLLTYTKISGPRWLTISESGLLSGMPQYQVECIKTITCNGYEEIQEFEVLVSDGEGLSSSKTMEITLKTVDVFTEIIHSDFRDFNATWSSTEVSTPQNIDCSPRCATLLPTQHESSLTLVNGLDLGAYNQLKLEFAFLSKMANSANGGFLIQHKDNSELKDFAWNNLLELTNRYDFTQNIKAKKTFIFTESDVLNFSEKPVIRFKGQVAETDNGDEIKSTSPLWIDYVTISGAFVPSQFEFTNTHLTVGIDAVIGKEYSATFEGLYEYSGDKEGLKFTKVSGPDWLEISDSGILSGKPQNKYKTDVQGNIIIDDNILGNNVFTVKVSNSTGTVFATLGIDVIKSAKPFFDKNLLDNGTVGIEYRGKLNASDVDLQSNSGEVLNFSKEAGAPAWLTVANNGMLSGTPGKNDFGVNTFTFIVTDSTGGQDKITETFYIYQTGNGYPAFKKAPTKAEWLLAFKDAFDYIGDDINRYSKEDLKNILKQYAYGIDPRKEHDSEGLPITNILGEIGEFTVQYNRLKSAKSLGIDYQLQVGMPKCFGTGTCTATDKDDVRWLDVRPDDIQVIDIPNSAYETVEYSGILPFQTEPYMNDELYLPSLDDAQIRMVVSERGPFSDEKLESAELILSDYIQTKAGSIYESTFGFATPNRQEGTGIAIVDNNSPWLHYRDINKPVGNKTTLYYYKIWLKGEAEPADPEETQGKRWSFFNPLRKLEPGTWSWKVGSGPSDDSNDINWVNDVYSFKIDGSEEQYIPPTADQVSTRYNDTGLQSSSKLLMAKGQLHELLNGDKKDEYGKTVGENYKKAVVNHLERLLKKIVIAAKQEKYSPDQIAQLALIKAAGTDKIFKDVFANKDLRKLGFTLSETVTLKEVILYLIPKLKLNDCTGGAFGIRTYLGMVIALFDTMEKELHEEKLSYIYTDEKGRSKENEGGTLKTYLMDQMMAKVNCTAEAYNKTMLNRYEHKNYESHVVQKSIHIQMLAGLVIANAHPYQDGLDEIAEQDLTNEQRAQRKYNLLKKQAEEMFHYSYELWLYKGPHGGRTDGSWHNGFGYMSVNEDQLMATPWILSQLTGFDYMMHPWYRNNAKTMSYLRAKGNPGQYYGDKASDTYGMSSGGPALSIARHHAFTHPNNFWMRWQNRTQDLTYLKDGKSIELLSGEDEGDKEDKHLFIDKIKKMADHWHRWFYLPIADKYSTPDFDLNNDDAPIVTADAYRDTGYVAAHTDLYDASKNFMVTMRSSPFGSAHKSHASQNAFTMAYGGKPLFYRTGFRKEGAGELEVQQDDLTDYQNSKAFNLILPNGYSQERGSKKAYAFLPRFLHGDKMTYWLGDASNTYTDIAGVQRFRRHMVFLKPDTLVVYDEVDSDNKGLTWDYRLNGHHQVSEVDTKLTSTNIGDQGRKLIRIDNGKAVAMANLFTLSQLETDAKMITTPDKDDHWSSVTKTTDKSKSVRFLNVIKVIPTDSDDTAATGELDFSVNGTQVTVTSGDYTIVAELDPDSDRSAHLSVTGKKGTEANGVALLYTKGVVNKLTHEGIDLEGRYKSSTLFIENTDRGNIIEELVDELPDSVAYSNKY